MKLILLERIAKLGRTGDIVSVRDGYARNFLLPRQRALRATPANMASFEARREEIEARNLQQQSLAEGVAADLEGKVITSIQQAGETGQLYGSVNAREIARLLGEQNVSVTHGQIILDTPIKNLGLHAARVSLHGDVFATLLVNVARSEEEAARQLAEKDKPSTPSETEQQPSPALAAEETEAEPEIPEEVAAEFFEQQPERAVAAEEQSDGA